MHQDIHSVKNVGEHSWKSEYHLHQWGVGKNAVLHTEDMSKLKRIKVCCEKHWPGFRTVNNRAVKNSHISPLWSHSWLRVSQQLCCTNARRACRKRCSRAEQTNYTPVKAVALHCIIPTVTLWGFTLAQESRHCRAVRPGMCGSIISPTIKCLLSFIRASVWLKQSLPWSVDTKQLRHVTSIWLQSVLKLQGRAAFTPWLSL